MQLANPPHARGIGLALLLLLAALPAAGQRMPGDTVEVLSLRFEGTTVFSDELLRSAIMTTPTHCISVALQPLCWVGVARGRQYLDPRALAGDMLRLNYFYRQRGYRHATIALDTTRRGPGGVHLVFRIDAGRPVLVHSITIEGAESMGRALTRRLPLRVGKPLNEIELHATRDTLKTRLADRGFAGADALANYEIRADDPFRADVAYTVVPGPLTRFGPITVTGTERVSPVVVQRMLVFREGDFYSRQALLRSQRNIFGLEVFRHAEIVTPAVSGDTVLPVDVRVVEGDMHRVRVGVGASTTDFLSAEGRWVSRNFLGRARRVELRGRLSNMVAEQLGEVPLFKDIFEPCSGIYCNIAGSLHADFTQPWFFSPQNSLGAGVFVERFTVPDVYVRTSTGAYASVRRTVLGNGSISAGYRPELTELESDGDLIFCVNFIACEERDINVLRHGHWLAPIALSFSHDRSNSLFAPTRGYILRFDGEYAARATFSDFSYTRLLGEGSFYHDPFRGVVYATRLRVGWARSIGAPGPGLDLHPQKRFFAGGPNSVRGFAQYRLGPKLLTVDAAGTLAQPVKSGGAGCSAQEINAGSCDVSALARQEPEALDEQPVGGAVLLEGNLEVRFPVWGDYLRAAAFMDIGQVWRTEKTVRLGQLAWTPGLGIRYFSPIGPLRVDIGYNPAGAELLPVVTTEVCDDRNRPAPCTDILPDVTYAPGDLANRRKLRALPPVVWRPYDSFTDRLQFHFSIGQAF